MILSDKSHPLDLALVDTMSSLIFLCDLPSQNQPQTSGQKGAGIPIQHFYFGRHIVEVGHARREPRQEALVQGVATFLEGEPLVYFWQHPPPPYAPHPSWVTQREVSPQGVATAMEGGTPGWQCWRQLGGGALWMRRGRRKGGYSKYRNLAMRGLYNCNW